MLAALKLAIQSLGAGLTLTGFTASPRPFEPRAKRVKQTFLGHILSYVRMQKLKKKAQAICSQTGHQALDQTRRSTCISLLMNKGRFDAKLPRIWTVDRKRRVDRSSQKSEVKQSRIDRHAQRVRIQKIGAGGCFCFLIPRPTAHRPKWANAISDPKLYNYV